MAPRPHALPWLFTLALATFLAVAPSSADKSIRPRACPVRVHRRSARRASSRRSARAAKTRPAKRSARVRPTSTRCGAIRRRPIARWRTASEGVMRMEKITYRSRVGDLDIPGVRVPAARRLRAPKRRPALVWVHENIRGHLYEHYIPFVRDAIAKGLRRDRAGISRQHRLRQDASTTRSTTAAPKSTMW